MMRIMRTVGVATLRNSPDRLKEKTHSHGVSGSAGGKSLLLCQPPQPNGFFYGRCNKETSAFSSRTRVGPAETQVSEQVHWAARFNAGRVHLWTRGSRRTFQGSYRRINQKGCIAPLDAVSHRSQAERSSWKRHVFLQKHCMAKASFLCSIGERRPMLRVWCWSKGRSNLACGSHQAEVEVSRACIRPNKHAGIVRELQHWEKRRRGCFVLSCSNDRQLVRVTGEGWGYAQSWGSPERRNGRRRKHPRTKGFRVSAAPSGMTEGEPSCGMARCAHQTA